MYITITITIVAFIIKDETTIVQIGDIDEH
jgi:hypothetical protein